VNTHGILAMSGRRWAYTGAFLGGIVSIAANVAHSYVPPADSAGSWHPPTGAVVGAIFWPVALFVAIEILARIAWPTGKRWAALKFAGLLPVAVVAAVVSYRHLSGLLHFYREDALTAAIGPLAVDGLMVMATGALIATGARRRAIPAAESAEVPAPAEVNVTPEPEVAPAESEPVATEPTPNPDADPAPEADPVAEAPAPTPTRKATPKRQPSARERIETAMKRSPKASDATIAARLGLSEATVKRHRKAIDSVSAPVSPANLHVA
jgi:hypothetical protein